MCCEKSALWWEYHSCVTTCIIQIIWREREIRGYADLREHLVSHFPAVQLGDKWQWWKTGEASGGTEGALWGSADRQQRAMGGCTRRCTHTHIHARTHTGRHTQTQWEWVRWKLLLHMRFSFFSAEMPCMASTSFFLKKCVCVTHVKKIQESYFIVYFLY